eukprot:gene22303-biopygen20730
MARAWRGHNRHFLAWGGAGMAWAWRGHVLFPLTPGPTYPPPCASSPPNIRGLVLIFKTCLRQQACANDYLGHPAKTAGIFKTCLRQQFPRGPPLLVGTLPRARSRPPPGESIRQSPCLRRPATCLVGPGLPDSIVLQEAPLRQTSFIPEGYCIPRVVRTALRKSGPAGRCTVITKGALDKLIYDVHVFGGPHQGFSPACLCWLPRAHATSSTSMPPPTTVQSQSSTPGWMSWPPTSNGPRSLRECSSPCSPNQTTMGEGREMATRLGAPPQDSCVVVGDLNFSPHGQAGYSADKAGSWLDEDDR